MMHSTVMTVTPEQAGVWLERNYNNRRVNATKVAMFAKLMAAGLWELSPQGIAFFEGGNLADGQHRLMAIRKAGVSVKMLVIFDVPRNNRIFDRGGNRSQADVLKLAGLPGSVANNSVVALINFLPVVSSNHAQKTEDSTVISFATDYESQLAFCGACTGHQGALGRKASVAAAVFCALLYGVPTDTLDSFMRVVNSGFVESSRESAAIVVRNLLLTDAAKLVTLQDRKRVFMAVLNGIEDYFARTPRKLPYKSGKSKYWDYVQTTIIPKYWGV